MTHATKKDMARPRRSVTTSGAFINTAFLLTTLVDACKAIVYKGKVRPGEARAFVDAYNAIPNMNSIKDMKTDGKYTSLSDLVNKAARMIADNICRSRKDGHVIEMILRELPVGVIVDMNNIIAFAITTNDLDALAFWIGRASKETHSISLADPTTIDVIYNHPRRDEVVAMLLSTTHITRWATMYLYTFADDLTGVAAVFEKCTTRDVYGTALIVGLAIRLGRVEICKYIGENSSPYAASVFIIAAIPSSKSPAESTDCFRALFGTNRPFARGDASAIINKAIISNDNAIIDMCLGAMDPQIARKAVLDITKKDGKKHVDSLVHIIRRGYVVNREVLRYTLEKGTIDSIRKVIASRIVPYGIYVLDDVADIFMRTGVITRDVRKGLRYVQDVSRDDLIDFRDIQRAVVGLTAARVNWVTDVIIVV